MGAVCGGFAAVAPSEDASREFEKACISGDRISVRGALAAGRPPWLDDDRLTYCLLKACGSDETDAGVVAALLAQGADVNVKNVYGNTPLHLCALTRTAKEKLVQRKFAAAKELMTKGPDLSLVNRDGHTALIVACINENELMAELLAARGGIWQLFQWSLERGNDAYWVAGGVLCQYAFEDAECCAGIRQRIMKLFDKDGDGKLNRTEMRAFLKAYQKVSDRSEVVRMQRASAGPSGTSRSGGDTSRSFYEMSETMVRVGRDLDLDKAAADATFAWDDLLPMVKHFYRATWNLSRPADKGWASFREQAVEGVARVQLSSLRNIAATRVQASVRGALVRKHWVDIQETNVIEKAERARRREVEAAAVRVQSIARGNAARAQTASLRVDAKVAAFVADDAPVLAETPGVVVDGGALPGVPPEETAQEPVAST